MKKRQRKKNHKKYERDFIEYLELLKPMVQDSNRRLKQMCHWRGHNYIYVEWPDYKGYICKCCGDKIKREATKKLPLHNQN